MNFKTGLKEKTTKELISTFQNVETPQNDREHAFIVLCTRFRKELLEKSEVVCKRFGHSVVVAEQISDQAFRKYAQKPNYQESASNAMDYDTGFIFYLFGIAEKELTNYYRIQKRRQDGCDYDGSEQVISELPLIPEERLDLETKVKRAAIESLSPKHKTVYLTYEVHERKGFNLPRKLQAELREHLSIKKQSTIRSLKMEAISIINSYMKAMSITKNELNGESHNG